MGMVENTVYNLCLDIGNTRNKIGIFQKEDLILVHHCDDAGLPDFLNKAFLNYPVRQMIVSSTKRQIPSVIEAYGNSVALYIVLSHETPLPISVDYETPETLGRDRIAGAVGAFAIFPGEPVVIIDAGTCITCDFLDKDGVFRGGNISPGMQMRLQAMHQFTGKLPLAPFELPGEILGKSTIKALQNGAIQGTIFEIDSFIKRMQKKFGSSQVIFTGGNANNFVDYYNSKIFVVQNLVLIGLNKIINYNAN